MKKFILTSLIMSLLCFLTFGKTKVGYSGCYSIPCYKCNSTLCKACPTWRRFDLEKSHYVFKYDENKKDYVRILVGPEKPGFMIYKCSGGHTLYVSTTSEERM